jgi:hypothetical protein
LASQRRPDQIQRLLQRAIDASRLVQEREHADEQRVGSPQTWIRHLRRRNERDNAVVRSDGPFAAFVRVAVSRLDVRYG